jgi:methionyl-tRNA formyltransferase
VTRKRSVVLLGSRSTQSVIGLKVLTDLGISVPLVITGNEDPGTDDWRLSLAKAAREARYSDSKDLLILRDPHQTEVVKQIERLNVDLILSLQWRRILRKELRGIARQGIVNLHNAPLPLLRGCDPFSWAIHDGLERMGITLHQVIDDGVDSGPILAQRFWPISSKPLSRCGQRK